MSSSPTRILGLATAMPDHELDAAASKALLAALFHPPSRIEGIIEQQGIQKRRVIREASWYLSGASFAERNAVAVNAARHMTEQASKAALIQARLDPSDVAAIVMITSTILAMPGLETWLIHALDLQPSVLRIPVWGRGCAGGAAGVNIGARLSESFSGRPVLVVVVDCCTANVQAGDRSLTNILISGLYADGAAAMVIGAGTNGPETLGSRSTVVPGTSELGGWDLVASGLRYRHHTSITAIANEWIPGEVRALLMEHGIGDGRPPTVILQPANAEALRAQSESMALAPAVCELNNNNLRTRGNLSGPAVLFALDDLLRCGDHAARPEQGGALTLVGTGPGYSIEQVLLRMDPVQR